MPRTPHIRPTGQRAEFVVYDEGRAIPLRRQSYSVEALQDRIAEAQDRICRSNASDLADTVRYSINQPDRVLTRAVLGEMRERMLQVSARPKPWQMEVNELPDGDGIRLEAYCWRAVPQEGGCETYTSYRLDYLKSRSTGTVCYRPDSPQPLNGDPREEFETWALKELAKDHKLQKWPPF